MTEQRIRFGSDGNGIFVAVSVDGGKLWRHFDTVAALDRYNFEAQLPLEELLAGAAYLRGEWHPGQPWPCRDCGTQRRAVGAAGLCSSCAAKKSW